MNDRSTIPLLGAPIVVGLIAVMALFMGANPMVENPGWSGSVAMVGLAYSLSISYASWRELGLRIFLHRYGLAAVASALLLSVLLPFVTRQEPALLAGFALSTLVHLGAGLNLLRHHRGFS